jgi:thioredoxin 1
MKWKVLFMHAFDTPITTSDQSIQRVLSTGLPVALVFLDGQITPELEEAMDHLAKLESGQLLMVKVQVKDNPETTHRYQVTGTPAVVTIRQGQVLSKAETVSGNGLERQVAYLLGKGPEPQTYSSSHSDQASGASESFGNSPRAVSDATFESQVMENSHPVLVDFWAPWCGPCRMMEPILEKLAHEMEGRLNFAKVNVDQNPYISQRYGIQSIPTMMLVKDGQIIDRWIGALPEVAIRNKISTILSR